VWRAAVGPAADCANVPAHRVPIALLTNYLADYRRPLYAQLAEREHVEVLCYGGSADYVPAWFGDLDRQLATAEFPARRLQGARAAYAVARDYDAVIAPFAGGSILPSAYAGARRHRRAFVLWASVWAEPRSAVHLLTRPITRHIYRRADAVVAYGEHVRRFVASIRGRDSDVFVAPQAVEPELFARDVEPGEIASFRATHDLPEGPLILYAGRLVQAKGIGVLRAALAAVPSAGTLVAIGDGPLAGELRATARARVLGPLPRSELPVAYAAAELAVLPSVRTPRFLEPWGLVCNEAMHQGRPVVATDAVGAVAGGLVRDGQTGLVVKAGDSAGLAAAIDTLLADEPLRARLGAAAREAVSAYTYDAMVEAFDRALVTAAAAARS
jgi:glycosyltransferase involved in cell wall biosynthesis